MNSRKIGIILAVILGIGVALYLGGLAGQLMAGYDEWMQQDGLTGGATMRPIYLSPIYCIPHAFSGEGLKGTLFILAAAGAITLYVKIHNRFSRGEYDERNFKRSTRGTYGTAAWMSEKEMRENLEVTTPNQAKGVILGEKNGKVVCLPEDTMLGPHIALFGSTGSMKSRAFVRNYLFGALKRGQSVICTDPKGELYADTASMFRDADYTVRVYNLVSPENSDSWNCMVDLGGDTLVAQILTDVIFTNTREEGIKGDRFWDDGEKGLLKALILFVDQDATRVQAEKHLPAVYQLLTNNSERQLEAIFDKLPMTHPAKAPYSYYRRGNETVRAGIVTGLGTRLQVLQNAAIRRITSGSDIDLTEPGKSKCIYYIIMSDQDNALDFISSLFFSMLFLRLVRFADAQPDGRCPVPVAIMLEEACTVGAINNLSRRMSNIRSRNLSVCMVIQSLPQLRNRYPNDLWAEILGCCSTQLMFGCTDQDTAEFISVRTGDMTVEVNSNMTMRKTIAVAQVIPQYRAMEGQGRRRLLTVDEVLRLPNDEMLIILQGQKVLKAKKFDYTRHPMYKQIRRSSVYDYTPQESQSAAAFYSQEKPSAEPALVPRTARPTAKPTLYSTGKPPDEF